MAEAGTLFHEKVSRREGGIMTYGMTPPKVSTDPAKLPALLETQRQRLRAAPVDAVILYDIHDEKERTPDKPRPFPFAATLNGLDWAEQLGGDAVGHPFVHFRCIAKYEPSEFEAQLQDRFPTASTSIVVVGGAASSQALPFTMDEAYGMCHRVAPKLAIGAVAIAERHNAKGDEHLRMLKKQIDGGVTYFVTQCVYNLEEAKNLLSDYALQCKREKLPMVPILITLTPCGSAKTLEFLGWLGVKVSKWLENDLLSAAEEGMILEESVDALLHLFQDLLKFARQKGIPLGCNVESVAIRKAEIEASVRLATEVRGILNAAYGGGGVASTPAADALIA